MKNIIYLFFALFFTDSIAAQNLIQNGSFENYTFCPGGANGSGINLAPPWQTANVMSTPVLFNVCETGPFAGVPSNLYNGYQYPNTGNGYTGISVYSLIGANLREYLRYPLSDTLKAGKTYCLSFYVNLFNESTVAIDAIGAYFSKTALICPTLFCLLNYTPQVLNPPGNILYDTLGWMQIQGCFIAEGNERFMHIGNFNTDSLTQTGLNTGIAGTAYYIDDVSLYEDTALGVTAINDENYFSISPNPATEFINLNYSSSDAPTNYVIMDVTGKKIMNSELKRHETKIDVSMLRSGIYFFNVNWSRVNQLAKNLLLLIISRHSNSLESFITSCFIETRLPFYNRKFMGLK